MKRNNIKDASNNAKSKALARKLAAESKLVRNESMKVLAEFDEVVDSKKKVSFKAISIDTKGVNFSRNDANER